jgi:hypothetical protein
VLLRGSQLLENSFLPRGIENGQLLQYGHAYQLIVRANVKAIDVRAREYCMHAERCKNGNATNRTTQQNVNFFIDHYCK